MGNVLVTESSLQNIADSIRAKKNVGTVYKPSEMAAAIDSIPASDLITKTITSDGVYSASSEGADGYSRVTVNTGGSGLAAILGNFATVEASSTASKAYEVGEYLVYNELLYEVTTAIAQGGTITPGTNCTQTTVGDELTSVNEDLTNQATLSTLHGSNNFKVLTFTNTTSISVDLGHTQNSSYFCSIVVFCANQDVMASIHTGNSIITSNYGGNSVSASISGQTLTITYPNGPTLWGATLVLVASSYSLI